MWTDDDGPPLPTLLSFGNLESIVGNVTFQDLRTGAKDLDPITIQAIFLDWVEGSLVFHGMPNLKMPSFESLNSVSNITFANVTFVESTVFGAETFSSLNAVQSMTFMNTSVTSIGEGWDSTFNLPSDSSDDLGVFSFEAVDNANLQNITIGGYRSVPTSIHIERNSEDVSVNFPGITECVLNLQGVGSFTADNLWQIGSNADISTNISSSAQQSKLSTRQETKPAPDDGNLITNNNFKELDLPNLNTIIGPFELSSNSALRTISFAGLLNIYGEAHMIGELTA